MNQKLNRFENNFDFIRLVAAMMVTFGHVFPLVGRYHEEMLARISGGYITGGSGVSVFFSISGYLICQSILYSKNYYSYLWKRLVRLIPGLWVVLFLLTFLVGPILTDLPLSEYFKNRDLFRFLKMAKMYPYYKDLLPGVFQHNPLTNINGSLWTIAYEFTMYLVLLVLSMGKLLEKRGVLVVLFVVGLGCYYAILQNTERFIFCENYLIPVLHLKLNALLEFGLFFWAGMLFYLYQEVIPLHIGLFALALFIWLGLGRFELIGPAEIKAVSLVCIPYIVFYLGFKKGILNNFGKYGDFSYGFYIYSFPVQQLIIAYYGPNLGIFTNFFLVLAIVFPLSYFSWHVIEKQALKYKSLFD